MEKKKDLRFQKTHKSIRDTFKSLMLHKDFKDISVTELSNLANINRKTFYLHYKSIEDLLKELETEIAEHILKVLHEEHFLEASYQMSDLCRAMNKILIENYDLHMRIISSDSCQFFVERVQEIIISEFLPEWKDKVKMSTLELKLIAFGTANGILSLYRMNYRRKLELSLEQIAELADKVISINNNNFSYS
ncbi:MAG: hypothetical protein A2Y21_11635 [Clostridiales bacterium GWC2_40_7]|nr:MAG: hypothetical protein A2Y21_11635 [Clostridiales bacterium GWC2_40_7]